MAGQSEGAPKPLYQVRTPGVAEDQSSEPAIAALLDAIANRRSTIEPDAEYLRHARLATLAAIVAPLLYGLMILSLIGGTAFYLTWVALPHNSLLLLAAATPPLVSLALLTVLIRPLFSKSSALSRVGLQRKEAPLLFDLVDRLSTAIGAPAPTAIYLDNQVNAYVNSANGAAGLRRGELELTIGAPLLFGLTSAELASVLAHEFGHFTQTREMLRSHQINRVARWLWICAYEPDIWEQKLEALRDRAKQGSDAVLLLMWVVIASLRASRRVFALLLSLNDRLTGAMSRQMEFNADDHAVAILGSALYVETEYRIHEMAAMEQRVREMNHSAYQENRLLRDIPSAIAKALKGLSSDQRQAIRSTIADETTEFWSTHPASKDRIARALALNVQVKGTPDFPARDLLAKSAGLGERTTLHHYVHDLRLLDAKDCLADNASVFQLYGAQTAEEEAFQSFFGSQFENRAPLFSADPLEPAAHLPSSPGTNHADWRRGEDRLNDLFLAGVYASCGLTLPEGTWDILDHSSAAVDREYAELQAKQVERYKQIAAVDRHARQRVSTELARAAREDAHQGQELLNFLVQLAAFDSELCKLRQCRAALGSISSLDFAQLNTATARALSNRQTLFASSGAQIHSDFVSQLGGLKTPLAGRPEAERLRDFLASWEALPIDSSQATESFAAVEASLGRFHNALGYLTRRAMARLALLCTRGQSAVSPSTGERASRAAA